MSPNSDNESVVEYTVKELLARIEKNQAEGFSSLREAMNGKADAKDLARLAAVQEQHGKDIADLKQSRHGIGQIGRVASWAIGTGLTALGLAAVLVAPHL